MEGMNAWQDKTALVTGASSGIGRATAIKLLQAGMNVVASARRQAQLDAIGQEQGVDPGRLLAKAADLRNVSDIIALFEAARDRFDGVDVLVNNAGLGHNAPLMSGSTDHWREMLEVNVLALCVCTREALSDMRRRGDRGHVIHISSMAGHRVPGGSGVYSATKYAVRSLTEGLRQELREANSAIRVSAISPGYVETGFAAHYHHDPTAAERTYGRFKVLQSEDVADAVLYVLTQPAHVQIHDLLMRPTDQPH
jgi:NADP-dependent 3-hydroxy acid dehydrogenase YdfG